MPYNIVDQKSNGYGLIAGEYFSDFDAEQEFQRIISAHFPQLQLTKRLLSNRTNGNRRDALLEVRISDGGTNKSTAFFVYVFPTESGGRWNAMATGKDEARIQWRPHASWTPDLKGLKPAKTFSDEVAKPLANLQGIECYVFAIYKRNVNDQDVIISAAYPSQVRDYEISGTAPSSIQYRISDIQDAYINGISYSPKTNNQRIIHFQPKYLLWYMLNRDELHTSILEKYQEMVDAVLAPAPLTFATAAAAALPWNKIIYGAPGTGKSYRLRDQLKSAGFAEANLLRVTFHPSYSYSHFIGTYKPTPIYRSRPAGVGDLYASDRVSKLDPPMDKEPLIDYSFVAGPLLNLYIKARKNPDDKFALIIEEINRADVSSVFGDTFQLLDRLPSGESEFEITFNADVRDYLKTQGIANEKVRFPANLYIWATMNSADQGVRPLDSAFKRRWSFEYLPLDENAHVVAGKTIRFIKKDVDWNIFRRRLNQKLKDLGVPEDKLLGPFFLNQQELADQNAIKNKLLLYLRDDVVRHQADRLFVQAAFSDIAAAYDKGDKVFVDSELEFNVAADAADAPPAQNTLTDNAAAEPAEGVETDGQTDAGDSSSPSE